MQRRSLLLFSTLLLAPAAQAAADAAPTDQQLRDRVARAQDRLRQLDDLSQKDGGDKPPTELAQYWHQHHWDQWRQWHQHHWHQHYR